MSFYLDASVILPTLIVEPSSGAVTEFINDPRRDLVVSAFAAVETASAISRLIRMGSLDLDDAMMRLADLDAWRAAYTENIELKAADVKRADDYVRRFDLALRAPDALHAALCRRGDHTLVTLDARLAAAATALGVRVAYPA